MPWGLLFDHIGKIKTAERGIMTLNQEDLNTIRQIVRDELSAALNTVMRANAELLSSLPLDQRKRRLIEWGGCYRLQPDANHQSPKNIGGDVKP